MTQGKIEIIIQPLPYPSKDDFRACIPLETYMITEALEAINTADPAPRDFGEKLFNEVMYPSKYKIITGRKREKAVGFLLEQINRLLNEYFKKYDTVNGYLKEELDQD